MKRIEETGSFELSSGKRIDLHKGIIGINDELNEIYEGYDGRLDLCRYDYITTVDGKTEEIEINDFTPEEITEICDYAIGLWQKMKEKHGAK